MQLMDITAVEAAQTVHATTRKSCLNCHGGAGGGDGTKRGDMSSALIDPDPHTDVHMSSAGADLVCADCHAAGNHRVVGRGVDLRPNDVPGAPDLRRLPRRPATRRLQTAATARPRYPRRARRLPELPHSDLRQGRADGSGARLGGPALSDAACNGRGGWLPREDKQGDLVPDYRWFDGTSEVYYLTEPVGQRAAYCADDQEAESLGLQSGSSAYVLGMPNGGVASDGPSWRR
jgi:hypothetical protein